jgi:Na+/proline symporter
MFGNLQAMLVGIVAAAYTWLVQNIASPVVGFAKDFQLAAVFAVTVAFIMVSMFMMLRQAKRLPQSYVVEIVNVYGQKVSLDGVRQQFHTYDAAESYARMYRENFGPQYRFKVVGQSLPGKS